MIKAARDTLLQAYPNAPWRNQVQVIGVFALGVVVIAMLAGVYLDVSVKAATLGREIQDIQADVLALQRTNADLETRLAELTSAAVMENRAIELGFLPVSTFNLHYLPIPGYVPAQEAVLAPSAGPTSAGGRSIPEALNQTLFDWLREEILEPDGAGPTSIFFPAPQTEAPAP